VAKYANLRIVHLTMYEKEKCIPEFRLFFLIPNPAIAYDNIPEFSGLKNWCLHNNLDYGKNDAFAINDNKIAAVKLQPSTIYL